ncbi:MAG TPA: hypothetical protein VJ438_00245 [Candidatus Nanoarchaeia archaeon]|nr:hypothetical protein [Candidatus Nanoarchaeia archaeon]
MDEDEFINKFPEEDRIEIRKDLENLAEENEKLIEEFSESVDNTDKNPVGRPIGIPASNIQKEAVSKAAKEYQRKLREGLIEKPAWETHGAYSYMSGGKVPKKKRYLLEFVYKEREKWLEELGGEGSLTSIEISMLDEASRLLLFSTMVNDYLLSDADTDVVYKGSDGDIKMHTGLSRHYLSFTKSYIQILKELQKIATTKTKKKGGSKKDSASILQKLYKES